MAVRRRRLDAELVRRGLATDTDQARAAIAAGRVTVDGGPALKPTTQVHAGQAIGRRPERDRYVSRGGHKLAAALAAFTVEVAGRPALDAGISTGGFTDCLLQHGTRSVEGFDVGYGQVHERLRTDARVHIHERTNIRTVTASDLTGPRPEVIVADLSFIALRTVLPALTALAADPPADVDLLLLVKPQFEVASDAVGEGGVVRDLDLWRTAVVGVSTHLAELGWATAGVAASPITGPAGNVEFLLHARRDVVGAPDAEPAGLDTALRAGHDLAALGSAASDPTPELDLP